MTAVWDRFREKAERGKQQPVQNTDQGRLNVPAYLAAHGVEILKESSGPAGSILHCLRQCVFDPNHSPNEAAIGQLPDGKLFYQCFHDSCGGHTWHDARQVISGNENLYQWMTGGNGHKKLAANASNRYHVVDSAEPCEPKEAKASDYFDHPSDVHVFLNNQPPKSRNLIKDRIPLGRGILVTGLGGSSKTKLLYNLAIGAITSKLPWNWEFERTGKAVLLLTEDTDEDAHRSLYYATLSLSLNPSESKAIAESLTLYPLAGKDIKLLVKTPVGTVEKSDIYHDFAKKIIEIQDVVFVGIDPALSISEGDELDQGHQRALGKMADDLAIQTGATVALVSHAKKASLGTQELSSHNSRGGGAITDAVRAEYSLRNMTADEASKSGIINLEERRRHVQLVATKGNTLPPSAYVPVWLRRDDFGSLHEAEISMDIGTLTSRELEILSVHKEISRYSIPNIGEWRKKCIELGLVTGPTENAKIQAMKRVCDRLRDAGLIKKGIAKGVWVRVE